MNAGIEKLAADYCALAESLREMTNYANRDAAHKLIAKMLGCHVTRNDCYTPTHVKNRKGMAAYAVGARYTWEGVIDHHNFIAKKGGWGGKLAGVITSPYPHVDVAGFCLRHELLCLEIPGCWGRAKTRLILPDDDVGLADAAIITAAFGLEGGKS